ncbi:hypothetical protein Presley_46 [Acinetobacter phage Presley]|uniref:Uncharacterized protein n=1 Tax=Acinetobacter phage Presley TaxID=1406780 RepID=U5PZW7_9CAUD|nr:hypothetical protein Presley_46 [Acinetobacter phage Presley]AGY48113.1 hypothetical protein Presley_46 [Acinetobacter phage Presley]
MPNKKPEYYLRFLGPLNYAD